ncbi:penicillin-binding transpeptidase domain-containing protein [Streptomyces cirratus]
MSGSTGGLARRALGPARIEPRTADPHVRARRELHPQRDPHGGAYETFAAGGMHTDPYSVRSVTRNGAALPLEGPKPTRAVKAETARAVTDALRSAVIEGSAKAAAKAYPGTAGKTGTTAANTAGWFVGSTEHESTAVVVYRMALTDLVPLRLTGLGGDTPNTPGSDRRCTSGADYIKAVK